MKRYDCGILGEELCVARDPLHHYLIKFTIVNGKWVMGNKRNVTRIAECYDKKAKFTMTMGYYEETPVLKMKIREEFLKQLMDYVSSQ
jgi:hypothetical protein